MLVITGPSLGINIKTPTLEMVTRSWTLPELVRSLQRPGAEGEDEDGGGAPHHARPPGHQIFF